MLLENGIDARKFRSSGWANIRCPFHEDKTPSMGIHVDTGGWSCSKECGKGRDIISFLCKLNDQTPRQVRDYINKLITSEDHLMNLIDGLNEDDIYQQQPAPLFYERGVTAAYMLERGFTPETLAEWKIGWDSITESVVFPVYEGGDLIGLISRPMSGKPAKYLMSEGFYADNHIFGLDMAIAKNTDYVIVVEGPTDAIYLWQCGYPAVATFGSSISRKQMSLISSNWWKVYLGADMDSAGRKLIEHVIVNYPNLDLYVMEYPDGLKDANSCTPQQIDMTFSAAKPSLLYSV